MDQLRSEGDDYHNVLRLARAAWASQALGTLASLSVAEHLESEALTAGEIADRESVDAEMAYRLLHACAALGLLDYDAQRRTFSTTPMLRVLHGDAPESLKHYVQAVTGPVYWLPAMRMTQVIAKGRNQAVEALGSTAFEYLADHPDEGRTFALAMNDVSTPVIREAVSVIDVGDARHAVDVGGSNGVFVSELVSRHPQLTGSVLDLAHVMPGVSQEANRRGLADRITGIAGDFFEAVPAADIFLLKFILHDWDDPSCRKLLANVRASMNTGARVFIVEMVVERDKPSVDTALLDLVMLFGVSGKERDLSEFEALLSDADMRVVQVLPLRGAFRVIEAVAA